MLTVVIDANISLAQIIPLSYSRQVDAAMRRWDRERARIIVPMLWEYEVVSGLCRAYAKKVISAEIALQALYFLLDMRFETVPGSVERHQRALEWAERLRQSRAYDAQYLTLAEEFSAELWTGDRRLANGAGQLGVSWVRWVGEI